jgi:TonB-linked SusC/RagA family outer membrane protein
MNKLLHHMVALSLLLIAGQAWAAPGSLPGAKSPFKFKNTPGFLINKPNDIASWVLNGKVVDEKGEVLPGATIRVKGTNRAVSADIDGKFIIEIKDETEVILVSFLGYKPQEIAIGSLKTITIKLLPDAENKLNEVVVVGYGKQKKISVTGSLSSITVKEIEKYPSASLSNAISGKLPGVLSRQSSGEPGNDGSQIYIRGIATFAGGGRSPLILVDGVERPTFDFYNSQEIESFTVLKDASATAVFGARGANGVILITTKRGEVGKPKINFRSEFATQTFQRIPQYIDGYEYASLENEGLLNTGGTPRWTNEQLDKFRTKSDPYFYPNVDWEDIILKKTSKQKINNLNISGGTSNVRYFVNVGYVTQDGIYKVDNLQAFNTNADLKRYNFRSNVDIDLSKSLTLELGVGGNVQYRNYPGSSSGSIFDALRLTAPIAYPVTNPDGSPGGVGVFIGTNPYGQATQTGYQSQDYSTLQTNLNIKWDLSSLVTKGLSLNGRFGYDRYTANVTTRAKVYASKQYLGKDEVTGEDKYVTFREEQPLGYGLSSSAQRALYSEVSVNYNKAIGKHNISGLLLGNARDYVDLSAGDPVASLPFRRLGLAGRTTYNYDDRYLAEFNFGYNGSENFPKGKQFGFFPSISAGWIVSNEKFWNLDFVDQLKFRASYGLVGNDQIGDRFLFLTRVLTTAPSAAFGLNPIATPANGIAEDRSGNADVTWERSRKTNFGIDLSLFKELISLQVDYFTERRSDILLVRQTIPQYTGILPASKPYGNIGIVENRGLDALLEIKKTTSKGLFYSIRGNFTFARNKVIENDEPFPLYSNLSLKGQPLDQQRGLVALGIFQNQEEIDNSPIQTFQVNVKPGDIKYQDINGDGKIDANDVTSIGYSRLPEIMYGFGGTVAYKGFDVSIYFTGAARTSIILDGQSIWPFTDGQGVGAVLKEYYNNRWTPSNPKGIYPAVGVANSPNNFLNSTLWLRDASYLRLRNAEIGYTFPKSLVKHIKLSAVRAFINGTNLYTWDNVKIVDPEANSGTAPGYPISLGLNFGLQVTF